MVDRSPPDQEIQGFSSDQIGSLRIVTMAPNVGLHRKQSREPFTSFSDSRNSRTSLKFGGGMYMLQSYMYKGRVNCLALEQAFVAMW